MERGVSAATRWIANIFVVSAVLVLAVAAPSEVSAQASGSPLIKIPPAKLPPLAAAPSTAPAAAPTIALAPRALLPTHVQILRDPQGTAMAMYGTLTGEAASATGVVLSTFANSAAFDPTPSVKLMLADESDRQAQALFTATVRGVPVLGVAVAALGDKGGDVTVFYDIADAFAASFSRMQRTLKEDGGVQTVILSPVQLGDGSTIGLPTGWYVTNQGADSVDLRGPQGEFISLGAAMPVYAGDTGTGGFAMEAPCCEPRKAFETLFPKIAAAMQRRGFPPQELTGIVEVKTDEERNSGQGALILANLQVGGEAYTYFAAANAVASFADPWTLTLSGAMAPQSIFAAEFPMLMQIWNSYRAVHPDFGLNLALPDAVSGMDSTDSMLNAAITRRETLGYNASAGWDQVIYAMTRTEPAHFDEALAQPLVDNISVDTGRPWHIVPPAEYR